MSSWSQKIWVFEWEFEGLRGKKLVIEIIPHLKILIIVFESPWLLLFILLLIISLKNKYNILNKCSDKQTRVIGKLHYQYHAFYHTYIISYIILTVSDEQDNNHITGYTYITAEHNIQSMLTMLTTQHFVQYYAFPPWPGRAAIGCQKVASRLYIFHGVDLVEQHKAQEAGEAVECENKKTQIFSEAHSTLSRPLTPARRCNCQT